MDIKFKKMNLFENKKNVERYEAWFKKYPFVFKSEIKVLQDLLPDGIGFEIGIGTGLFAKELGVLAGCDPSNTMLQLAKKRNLITYNCKGDSLPFHDGYFDYLLMVTTLCFLDDVKATLKECFRVLRKTGSIIIGFVDKESPLGKDYYAKKDESLFYNSAKFYSIPEIKTVLEESGFIINEIRQTLFGGLEKINSVQDWKDGFGEGGFVAIEASCAI